MLTGRRLFVVLGALTVGLGVTAAAPTLVNAHFGERASATLQLEDGQRVGRVVFYGDPWTITRVTVTVKMPQRAPMAGFHGFHVHANNDPANGSGCLAEPAQPRSTWFASADGHLAEPGTKHGAHMGDLPPLLVTEQGRAYSSSITDRVEIEDLVGRAVVLHAKADNLGNVPVDQYAPASPQATELTERTGNAGDRTACGVITRL